MVRTLKMSSMSMVAETSGLAVPSEVGWRRTAHEEMSRSLASPFQHTPAAALCSGRAGCQVLATGRAPPMRPW